MEAWKVAEQGRALVVCEQELFFWFDEESEVRFFSAFVEAVAEKCGGNAHERYAWYGGTREELLEIVKHGFSHCGKPVHGQSYGVGVHLASAKYPMEE